MAWRDDDGGIDCGAHSRGLHSSVCTRLRIMAAAFGLQMRTAKPGQVVSTRNCKREALAQRNLGSRNRAASLRDAERKGPSCLLPLSLSQSFIVSAWAGEREIEALFPFSSLVPSLAIFEFETAVVIPSSSHRALFIRLTSERVEYAPAECSPRQS